MSAEYIYIGGFSKENIHHTNIDYHQYISDAFVLSDHYMMSPFQFTDSYYTYRKNDPKQKTIVIDAVILQTYFIPVAVYRQQQINKILYDL